MTEKTNDDSRGRADKAMAAGTRSKGPEPPNPPPNAPARGARDGWGRGGGSPALARGESGGAPRRGASRGDTGRRSAAVVVPPPRGLRNRQSSLREQAERAEGGTAPIRQPTGPNRRITGIGRWTVGWQAGASRAAASGAQGTEAGGDRRIPNLTAGEGRQPGDEPSEDE